MFVFLCNSMRMKRSQQISHPGIVEHVSPPTVMVRVQSQAACGNCHAQSHCGMAESVDKTIEVETNQAAEYAPGQPVEVFLQRSLGFRALALGYMIPFLILVVSLFAIVLLTGHEGLAALISFGLMIPYYAILYHWREKLRKTFHFYIRPASQTA